MREYAREQAALSTRNEILEASHAIMASSLSACSEVPLWRKVDDFHINVVRVNGRQEHVQMNGPEAAVLMACITKVGRSGLLHRGTSTSEMLLMVPLDASDSIAPSMHVPTACENPNPP